MEHKMTVAQIQALYDLAVLQHKHAREVYRRMEETSIDPENDAALASAGDAAQFASGIEHVAYHLLKFAKRDAGQE